MTQENSIDCEWGPTTSGGYWVRGIERVNGGLRGEVGNHSLYPQTDDPAHWHVETWTDDGKYLANQKSVFDLVECNHDCTLERCQVEARTQTACTSNRVLVRRRT